MIDPTKSTRSRKPLGDREYLVVTLHLQQAYQLDIASDKTVNGLNRIEERLRQKLWQSVYGELHEQITIAKHELSYIKEMHSDHPAMVALSKLQSKLEYPK